MDDKRSKMALTSPKTEYFAAADELLAKRGLDASPESFRKLLSTKKKKAKASGKKAAS